MNIKRIKQRSSNSARSKLTAFAKSIRDTDVYCQYHPRGIQELGPDYPKGWYLHHQDEHNLDSPEIGIVNDGIILDKFYPQYLGKNSAIAYSQLAEEEWLSCLS